MSTKKPYETLNMRGEILEVIRKGRVYRSDYFMIRYLVKPETDVTKCAVNARKKIAKKAVVRNYARRRLKELLRKNPPVQPGYFIIIAGPLTHKVKFAELKDVYDKVINNNLR